MLIRLLAFFMFTAFSLTPVVLSAEPEDNSELQRLFEADQNARRDPNMSWDEIDALDEANRSEVLSMLARGEIRTGLDYFHAAVILQHGERVEEIRLAHSFGGCSIFCVSQVFIGLYDHPVDHRSGCSVATASGSSFAQDATIAQTPLTYPRKAA